MYMVLTQTTELAGSTTLAQRSGSSGFALMETSSSTVTSSPWRIRVTISLLMAAWPRRFTFFSLATAGPGLRWGRGFSTSAEGLAADFFVAALSFFLASAFLLSLLESALPVGGAG